MYRPGDTLVIEFITSSAAGAPVDADALPTAVLARNGIDDATVVTVVKVDTGRYKATCVINAGWVASDTVALLVLTTVAAVAKKTIVYQSSLTQVNATLISDLLSTSVPATNTPGTVADGINAARAQGFGAWTLSGTVLTLYGPDGVTPVRVFSLNSATSPTSRA